MLSHISQQICFINPVIFNEHRLALYLACILMCSAFKYVKEIFLLPLKLQMKKWQRAKKHKYYNVTFVLHSAYPAFQSLDFDTQCKCYCALKHFSVATLKNIL